MIHKRLALTVTAQSLSMILGVYVVMQIFTYWKDNLILGLTDLASMPAMIFSFMASNVLPPALVLGAIMYILALRIQRFGERLEKGEELTPDEIERARTKLLEFSTVVLIINLFGFAAGYILLMLLKGRIGDMIHPDRLVILFSNLAGGVVYASAQTALHNSSFAELRERLGIKEIGRRKRERSSTTKQVFLTLSLAVYAITFIQFNVRDAAEYDIVGDEVLSSVVAGRIAPEAAGTEFRRLLGERLETFISRPGIKLERVQLPWERSDAATTRQQRIFFIYALFILVVMVGIQVVVSRNVKQQLASINKRVKDVLDGGGDPEYVKIVYASFIGGLHQAAFDRGR